MAELLTKPELTTHEAAQLLRITPVQVWRNFQAGRLRGWRTSQRGRIKIETQSVIDFAQQEQGRSLDVSEPKKKK